MTDIVDQLEDRLTRLISEVRDLRGTKNRLEEENDTLRITVADHEKITTELDETRRRIADLENANGEIEQLRAAADDLETLRNDREATAEALAAAQEELRAATTELQAASARIEELEELATAPGSSNGTADAALKSENEELKTRIEAADERDGRMRERLTRMIDRIQAAEVALEQLELVNGHA